jgi:hypothetical protein
MWQDWTTGRRDWDLGRVVPDEVLYYLNGPAIFTCRIGLSTYLFFKSDEYEDGDYYLAAPVSDREIVALRNGRLSVRGGLSQSHCWLMQTDFDLNILRYEMKSESDVRAFLPKAGVPLIGSFSTAADSISQTDSLFAFKFFGDELSEEGMPFSTFKGLVDSVYDVVRKALTPNSLSGGRDRNFIDFSVRQPEFASLLIAIDDPEIDVARLAAQRRTRNLDPNAVAQEAYERGREFAEQIERTVDLAMGNRLPANFAADNFAFVQQIVEILPSADSDISRLQFSSTSGGAEVFVDVDATAGDRIRESYALIAGRDIQLVGVVDGIIGASKTFRLRTDYGREVTCQLGWNQFDELTADNRLRYGVRVAVSGRYVERQRRDWMKVEGNPVFF